MGHPLLDEITKFKQELTQSDKIVYMPGSRKTEITNLMPIFRELSSKIKDKKHILIIPSKFDEEYIKKLMETYQILQFQMMPIKS